MCMYYLVTCSAFLLAIGQDDVRFTRALLESSVLIITLYFVDLKICDMPVGRSEADVGPHFRNNMKLTPATPNRYKSLFHTCVYIVPSIVDEQWPNSASKDKISCRNGTGEVPEATLTPTLPCHSLLAVHTPLPDKAPMPISYTDLII
jgi:hypothetical protein